MIAFKCVVDVCKMAESEDFIEFLRNRQVSEKVLETLKGPPIIYQYLMLRQPFMSLPFSAGLMTVRCIWHYALATAILAKQSARIALYYRDSKEQYVRLIFRLPIFSTVTTVLLPFWIEYRHRKFVYEYLWNICDPKMRKCISAEVRVKVSAEVPNLNGLKCLTCALMHFRSLG